MEFTLFSNSISNATDIYEKITGWIQVGEIF